MQPTPVPSSDGPSDLNVDDAKPPRHGDDDAHPPSAGVRRDTLPMVEGEVVLLEDKGRGDHSPITPQERQHHHQRGGTVENVRAFVSVGAWLVGLLCRGILFLWMVLVVYPLSRLRIKGDATGDALRQSESSSSWTGDALAKAASGMDSVVSSDRRSSPMPSVGSMSQLDQLASGADRSPAALAEAARAKELRLEVNQRLRDGAAAYCTPQTLRMHIATWNVAQQQPPGDNVDIRRWVLGDTLTEILDQDKAQGTATPLTLFPDVVVVGLQEVEFGGVALMVETTESSVAWTEAVTDCINSAVEWRVRYKKLRTIQLVGIVLIVVIRSVHEPFIAHVKTSMSRTGAVGGVLGNKGSIGLRMTLYGKRFLFVCAHFHPHLNKSKTRMKNYHNALSELKFELSRDADDEFDIVRLFDEAFERAEQRTRARKHPHADGSGLETYADGSGATVRHSQRTQGQSAWSRFFSMRSRSDDAVLKELKVLESHDYVFFFGDLNYRLHGLTGDAIRDTLRSAKVPVGAPSSHPRAADAADCGSDAPLVTLAPNETTTSHQAIYDDLIERHDELFLGMMNRKIFNGFEESKITFPPTYKYDLGTNRFDTSLKRREPAWTDRILFRVWDDQHPVAELMNASMSSLPVSDDETADSTPSGNTPSSRSSWVRRHGSALFGPRLLKLTSPPVANLHGSDERSPLSAHTPVTAAAIRASAFGDESGGGTPASGSSPQQQPQARSGSTTPEPFKGSSGLANVLSRPAAFSSVVPNQLAALGYHSIHSLTLSDHKPVLSVFSVSVLGTNAQQMHRAMITCRDLWDQGHCDVDAHLL